MIRDGTLLTAIDVGTTKVCTIIAEKTRRGRISILAYSVVPSEGLRKGTVSDITATVGAVRKSIQEAQREAGVEVQSAFVGVTGSHVSFQNRRDALELSGDHDVITAEDLTRIPQQVAASSAKGGRKVIHAIPVTYTLDGQNGIKQPLGMHSRDLEVESHVVTGAASVINKLVDAVERAGIGIEALVLEPLASSLSVLTPQEKERGSALVDIGGGTTDVVAFRKGSMYYTSVIPVGGSQFTNDICTMYDTPYPDAELAKLRYASTELDSVNIQEEVSLPVAGRSTELKVSRHDICQLARERAQELIRLIDLKLKEADLQDVPNSRIVLTGGASNLPGLHQMMQQVMPNDVRIGIPRGNGSVPDELKSPAYATGLGILLWALNHHTPFEAQAANRNGAVAKEDRKGFITRLLTQVRNLLPV